MTSVPPTRNRGQPSSVSRTALPVALMLAVSVLGCGTAAPSPPVQRVASPVVHLRPGSVPRIAVIVMENEEYGDVIGTPATPFITRLSRAGALATRAFAISHPSLPNYLALTGGSTFGVTDDCTSCSVPGAGLAGQLDSRGLPWRAYMQGMPAPCWNGDGSGNYAKKHNPFVYFRALGGDSRSCGAHVVAMDRLGSDERAGLPRFTWITPDLCNDMHDCDPAVGDRFLSGLVPPLLRALGRDGLLMLVWDEGTSDNGCCGSAQGGHVALILAGGAARAGARMATAVDHYSVLQTIEDLLGLPRIGGAACRCTPSLAPMLRGWDRRRPS